MIDTDMLRKADFFSGTAIFCLGMFAVYEALQMPMKDSYAGVQNVWYVSPALFPLLIGSMLALLGLLLIRTALKAVGWAGLRAVIGYLGSPAFVDFLKEPITIRFYGIVCNLLILVYVLVPRVDFFLAATLFLLVFFVMFYCGSDRELTRLIWFMLAGTALFIVLASTPLAGGEAALIPYALDWFVLVGIAALFITYLSLVRRGTISSGRFRTACVIAVAAPFVIGIAFKYFLLVPMPHEGLVVAVLDAIWYADFWS